MNCMRCENVACNTLDPCRSCLRYYKNHRHMPLECKECISDIGKCHFIHVNPERGQKP
jgi:hypothetical protein